jgi:hypothetical protein
MLPVPYPKQLQSDYLPAVLGHGDYPGMIESGPGVDTIAVSAVLIAYNWPKETDRYRRIAKFVNTFFPKLAEFQKPPRHPKWREANLAAVLPGWTRVAAAEEWLKQNRKPDAQSAAAVMRQQFDQFLAGRKTGGALVDANHTEERERLFQEFLKWQARERR